MMSRKEVSDTRSFVKPRLAFALAAALLIVGASEGCTNAPASEAPAPGAQVTQAPARPPATPYTRKHIYDETTDPKRDIASALQQAKREHKRVLLDFGGDWCGDCQVLDIYFHQSPNDDLLTKNFVLVHVFIGRMDKNLDVGEKYGVPVKNGVPALAVLDARGKALYSQQTGQFRDMRYMNAQSVTEFLDRWKA